MISVVLTVHNQEELLPSVFDGIELESGLISEYIIIFDGCTDSSEECFNNWYIPGMYSYNFKVIHADNVFETKANNLGLREVTNPYAVIVQDDCIIKERGWDRRLLEPFMKYDDVLAVTGNTAHNVFISGDTVDYNHFSNRNFGLSRDVFSIRDVVNRGPLMFDMNKLCLYDFLDEIYSPQACDDHDVCVKAYLQNRFISGCYWIDYESKPEWGSTRKGDNSWWYKAFNKNRQTFLNRYKDYLLGEKHDEERSMVWES